MTSSWTRRPSARAARSTARWATPKRCCSSMTASARSAKPTESCSRACVPTTMRGPGEAISSRTALRAASGVDPVSRRTPTAPPRGPSRAVIEAKCCSARTSVGATSAPWCPLSTTRASAASATTVLPEPTSPCRRRCIGEGRARSASMAPIAARWEPVSAKGSAPSRPSRTPPGAGGQAGASRARSPLRSPTRAHWRMKASPQARARRARRWSSSVAGRWARRRARARVGRRWAARTESGRGSGTSASSIPSRTTPIARDTAHEVSPPVAG